MRNSEGVVGVGGNKEVCELLEKWLTKAKFGKMNFIGLVGCDSPVLVYHGHAGVMESHMAAHFGLEDLRDDIKQAVINRTLREPDYSIPANLVCYDLAVEPTNYDFLAWLLTAEMKRQIEGAPAPLRVAFIVNPEEKVDEVQVEQSASMFRNVLAPLVPMCGAVIDPEAAGGRRYETYTCNEIVAAVKAGHAAPRMMPSAAAMERMAGYAGAVTITLREAGHWDHRNSNMEGWMRFAADLKAAGMRVVFVRDTALASELIPGFETSPLASQSVDLRMALYEQAKCNLFVSNGPWYLALFGTKPWLMFNAVDSMDPFGPNTPNWWIKNHGIGPGEQFPWCSPQQRIIWETDGYENLCLAWDQFRPSLG